MDTKNLIIIGMPEEKMSVLSALINHNVSVITLEEGKDLRAKRIETALINSPIRREYFIEALPEIEIARLNPLPGYQYLKKHKGFSIGSYSRKNKK